MDEMVKLTCDKCGSEFEIKLSTYKGRIKHNVCNYCKSCMKAYLLEKQKSYYANLSEEEKQQYATKRNWQASASEEKKKAYADKMRTIQASRSKEEQEEINKRNSEGLRKHWTTVSDDVKLKRLHNMRLGSKKYYASMTAEQRSEKAKHSLDNISPERRQEIHDKLSAKATQYNQSLSYDEKLNRAQSMIKWHQNLTPQQKQEFYAQTHAWYHALSDEEKQKYAESKRLLWTNLPTSEKVNQTKKLLTASSGKNQLHQRFERAFNESHLINDFYFQPEVILNYNDIIHSWDYGIYDKKSNDLLMVVDLDGAYFHADDRDYDGFHSKEEYDEARSLSIDPTSNIKICIIQEINFKRCFEEMIKSLMINYDEYVDTIFKRLRMMPFPVPHYSNAELWKSYSRLVKMICDDKYHTSLSLNTRIGDRLIMHFHESIWHAHTKGNLSPYEAWYDDDLLRKVIQNRIIYQNHLNPNKILQGFNVSKIAPKISVFSAGRAKMIIYKYLNEFNEIFDPFSGFSGRMLGAISLGKEYIGQDISEIHVRESNNIIDFLMGYKPDDIHAHVNQQDILKSSGEYQCLFTCPPYSDKEQWLDVDVDQRSCDDWIDECLSRFKCKKYVFVVDETTKYTNNIVDTISNRSHFSNNCEYIIVIER